MTAHLPQPPGVVQREAWTDQANCRGIDPALFHPERGDEAAAREAKRVCAGCDVTAECLDYALRTKARAGIYGGLAPRQRQGMTVRRVELPRTCVVCATSFMARSAKALYCSQACARAAWRRRRAS